MKKLENESVARALENVSRKMDRFKNVLFCFGLKIVKKKHDQERFGFDDAENFKRTLKALSLPSWSHEYVILNSGHLISVFIEEDSHEIGGELDFPHIFIN